MIDGTPADHGAGGIRQPSSTWELARRTENYGANWLRPASVQRGRNIRFGIQYRF